MDVNRGDAGDRQRIGELAAAMARDILDKRDHKRHEYVGVIYRDRDGQLVASALETSEHTMSAPLGKAIMRTGSPDAVVAVVHNHPAAAIDSSSNRDAAFAINKLPSNNDWKTVDQAFGGRQDLTYFVIGPDARLRAFEAADRETWDKKNELKYWNQHQRRFDAGPELSIPENGAVPRASEPPPRGADTSAAAEQATAATNEHQRLVAQARERIRASGRFEDLDEPQHDRLAAALAFAAFAQGMQRIEHVVASQHPGQQEAQAVAATAGTMVFAVQGRMSEPTHLRSQVSLDDALHTPVESSLARMAAHEASIRAQAPARSEVLQRTGPSLP